MKKMYLVEASSMSLLSYNKPIALFKDKIQAEYYTSTKNDLVENKNPFLIGRIFSTREIEIDETDYSKEKGFKKFLEKQSLKLEEEIKKEKDCIERDFETIKNLTDEKEHLEELLNLK